MEYDLTFLTFMDDPSTYQTHADEICVRVPVNSSSAEELINFLKGNLAVPAYCGNSWGALHDVLRYWGDWQTVPPGRVVLLHNGMPISQSERLGWLDLKIYLEILIDSIKVIQERNAADTTATNPKELLAIFPTQVYEELQAVLAHRPPWYATLGFTEDQYLTTEFEPEWSTILHYLQHLDGLTAEACTLSRQDLGMMTVQYNKHVDAYYLGYRAPDSNGEMIASLAETPSVEEDPSMFQGLSFALTSQVVETFFTTGERSPKVHWTTLSRNTEMLRRRWYERNDEEALLELDGSMKYETLLPGMQEAVFSGKPAFSLQYWQHVLIQPDAPLSQHLTALCIIGLSDLPEAPTLLRPFLHSQVKQERWVSARFCGMWGDEEALPILLSMLTDELPLVAQQANEYWYEGWRGYAPRLLRKWQTEEVGEQLRNSLALWLQTEPQFDQDIDIWKMYEEKVSYELGYREDFAALTNVHLRGEQRQELIAQMERGYKVKRLHMTSEEEYRYLRYRTEPER